MNYKITGSYGRFTVDEEGKILSRQCQSEYSDIAKFDIKEYKEWATKNNVLDGAVSSISVRLDFGLREASTSKLRKIFGRNLLKRFPSKGGRESAGTHAGSYGQLANPGSRK